jgi:hypothetical protein
MYSSEKKPRQCPVTCSQTLNAREKTDLYTRTGIDEDQMTNIAPKQVSQSRASDLSILPRHLGRIGLTASQEVKVERAADDVILQRGRTLTIAADLHIHLRQAENMGAIGMMLKVHRVVAVQVHPVRVTGIMSCSSHPVETCQNARRGRKCIEQLQTVHFPYHVISKLSKPRGNFVIPRGFPFGAGDRLRPISTDLIGWSWAGHVRPI